jgi:hypothetical protein
VRVALALIAVLVQATAAHAADPAAVPECKPPAPKKSSTTLPRKPKPAAAVTTAVANVQTRAAATAPAAPTCLISSDYPDQACLRKQPLCAGDLEIARIAWNYFRRNYQPKTGMVNAADNFPSTTLWDLASSLAGTIAARELELIEAKEFDDRVTGMMAALNTMKLFKGHAPNKVYNTTTGEMSDYANRPSAEGIGFSALDLGRIASWLELLGCMHPKYAHSAKKAASRWNYCHMLSEGQLYGASLDAKKQEKRNQEGRLGYEQYAGKIFARSGFDMRVSGTYENEHASSVTILGVPIPVDLRDPRKLGAYNFVVTESFALDAIELGRDSITESHLRNVYEVQKRRWETTGIVTAVSEDNVDRPPYFVYNTIYAAGTPWNAVTDQGVDQSALRTVSTKAAFALAALYPDDSYSKVLMDFVRSAYDKDKGWYSGIYENGSGYNKAITANTNGIILEVLLFKALGSLHGACAACNRSSPLVDPAKFPCCDSPNCKR